MRVRKTWVVAAAVAGAVGIGTTTAYTGLAGASQGSTTVQPASDSQREPAARGRVAEGETEVRGRDAEGEVRHEPEARGREAEGEAPRHEPEARGRDAEGEVRHEIEPGDDRGRDGHDGRDNSGPGDNSGPSDNSG